jgi:hypothetical protein
MLISKKASIESFGHGEQIHDVTGLRQEVSARRRSPTPTVGLGTYREDQEGLMTDWGVERVRGDTQ